MEELSKKLESVRSAILTYKEFLELFDNMASLLAKDLKMKDLNTILQKVYLNFTVNKKSVVGYTLNEPFASLESVETLNVSDGAR